MQGIGRACVVNPVNSVATILLATPRQSIEIEELIGQAELYERLIGNARCMASIRIEGKVDRSRVEDIAAQKVIHIRRHELGDVVYLKPENTVLLGYYRNNTLHTLVIPALKRFRVQRREVLEVDQVMNLLRVLAVHLVDPQQREAAISLFNEGKKPGFKLQEVLQHHPQAWRLRAVSAPGH